MSDCIVVVVIYFRQTLWDEMFSFDDKDISEEPVDFGHSAFDELVEAVDNPTYATRSVLDSMYNRGLWIECYLFPYKTCTMHYVKGFYSTYEGGCMF